MASISLYVVSTILIVLIGSVTCESHVCTSQTVDDCLIRNRDMIHECQNYNKTLLCLKNELQNCTDDYVIEVIEKEIKYNTNEKTLCPGLPEGVCYFSELKYHCGFAPYFHAEDTEKVCVDFNKKSSDMRTCMENLKLHCILAEYLEDLDAFLSDIDKVEKICADYKKTPVI